MLIGLKKRMVFKLTLFLFFSVFVLNFLSCDNSWNKVPEAVIHKDKNHGSNENSHPEIAAVNDDLDPDDLESSFNLWKAKKTADYNYEISWEASGHSPPTSPVVVKVRSGRNHSVVPVSETNTTGIEIYDSFNSIDEIFKTIRLMINNGNDVRVKYNTEYGYPEEILSARVPLTADGVATIRIRNFEVITHP